MVSTARASPTSATCASPASWENRSLYVAPLIGAAVFLFGFSISTITLPRRMRAVSALDPASQATALAMPYSVAATLIILTAHLVGVFYCLDALYGERRDRSILFWKSLPVSDLTTVLSKASIPLVVLPGLVFGIAVATQLVMLLLSTMVLLGSGLGVATLWTRLFQMTPVLVYGLTVHALWHAPLYAWLLLVSSWARRTPFLWAVLPPLGIGVVERIAFQTSYFGSLLRYRLIGAMQEAFKVNAGEKGLAMRLGQLDPLGFLGSAVAARMRRCREPI